MIRHDFTEVLQVLQLGHLRMHADEARPIVTQEDWIDLIARALTCCFFGLVWLAAG